MNKLSVVLATRNEEENLQRCLDSVQKIADEIIVVDEGSIDRTVEIAKKNRAKVFSEPHHEIFHITKQVALEKATGDWILQLDADEVVSPELAKEINDLVKNNVPPANPSRLLLRHQKMLGYPLGGGEKVAYFIPRRNMFLGRPLVHAGVYPDGVIRLIKKGKASFPQKSVHEQMTVEGGVGWLNQDLYHFDSPTLARYFERLNRYTDLRADELKEAKTSKNILSFLNYLIIKPSGIFFSLYIRHLGILDGPRGFLWSFFSASHYPIAYFKHITAKR